MAFRRVRWVLIVVGCLSVVAALAAPGGVLAWVENTTVARLVTPTGNGCIMQWGGLLHGGANDAMSMDGHAVLVGRTRMTPSTCNPLNNVTKQIGGRLDAGLIKATSFGSATRRDTW